MQQRYYDTGLGEFPSTDPVTPFSAGGAFNRYWYANANPYRMVDPDGRTPNEVYLASGGDWGGGQSVRAGKRTRSNTVSQSTDSDSGHFYQFTVELCRTTSSACTPQLMMSLGLKGAAPTANGQDVMPDKVTMLPMYPGGANTNPIIQHLDWENTTIVNVALPGHVFAGTVTHRFYESGGSVYETTTGVGNSGSWIKEQANLMVGYMYFRGVYQVQLVLKAQQATIYP